MPGVKIKLKEGVVPHFFECQTGRKGAHAGPSRLAFLKRLRQEIVEECTTDKKKLKVDLEANENADMPEEENSEKLSKNNETTDFKSVGAQANIRPLSKSKLIQCSLLQPPQKNQSSTCQKS